MDLFILRHGKAGQSTGEPDDNMRALTPAGRKEIKDIARWLKKEKVRFDLIATSPLIRARETAGIVARTLDQDGQSVIWDDLAPGGDVDSICYHIAQSGNDAAILVVGHEPELSGLTGKIISRGGTASLIFAKGGLAKIRDFSFDKQPAGILQWLLTAKQIQAMR